MPGHNEIGPGIVAQRWGGEAAGGWRRVGACSRGLGATDGGPDELQAVWGAARAHIQWVRRQSGVPPAPSLPSLFCILGWFSLGWYLQPSSPPGTPPRPPPPPLAALYRRHRLPEEGAVPGPLRVDHLLQSGPGASAHRPVRLRLPLLLRLRQPQTRLRAQLHVPGGHAGAAGRLRQRLCGVRQGHSDGGRAGGARVPPQLW